ncbi:MAG: GNAT family N-acetyltransferase [Clostridia bacterium]|nr:GNAT family N-acetyltransferase [Clostridia bacterium]
MTDLDVLINLYNLPEDARRDPRPELAKQGIQIKRALPCDRSEIRRFIESEFSEGWADEAERGLYNLPSSLFIATFEERVVGFAAYDSTALGYYGPLGVASDMRKRGIGEALSNVCLNAMREKGYGYIIINAGPVDYYVRRYNGMVIGDHIGVYENMIHPPKKDKE